MVAIISTFYALKFVDNYKDNYLDNCMKYCLDNVAEQIYWIIKNPINYQKSNN
ncbi:hypothetical protein HMPREF1584_00299 [Gardnerella vaginalis JCP8481A]|uniref:Uncharacterized protein n=1 Tax=Gardnerella vaginalis TaxID=2702 RepID=A0A133NZQ3_GARVA|nr:hypothetical protein HMPREF1585_00254 [Gardnerella vaginalis JCP8481B]EPI44129.1 hypothetical protein HMPREF1584_00299 [Gardnerella vaginalis JCP8481A]KXA21769.1 hypothetical protein HMPREF3208_00456 [Gardnerella vaginalis]